MGVYSRFKRSPEGFRALVELLETTPVERRKRMIEVGMAEDPQYTELAMRYLLTFQDVLDLSEPELAEVMAVAPPRTVGHAIRPLRDEIRTRVLRCAQPIRAAEVRDCMEENVGLRETGAAQLKVIEVTRGLERKGLIRVKKIPD